MTLFCDCRLTDEARALLEQGVVGNVIYPKSGVTGLGCSSDSLEGVQVAFGQPDPGAILASSTIRWVQISSAGITRYDNDAFRAGLRERSIILTNSSSVYDEPCAEHLLAMMLGAARNLTESLRLRCDHRSPNWQRLRESCPLVLGQSVLIVGYGAIARRFVEMLAPFRMNVVGFRRRPRGDEQVPMVSVAGLSGALGASDHIVNILPEHAETDGFFDRARFSAMRSGSLFYNVGRGTTVDQEALAEALHSGHLGGAWLDVTDPEPLPSDHPLLRAPNCHITPHVAGGHLGERTTLVRHFLENYQRFTTGAELRDRVV